MCKTFVRAHSALDLTVSISLMTVGLILVTLPSSQGVNILGFFMMFAGIILVMIYKSGYKNIKTGERLLKKEHYFPHSMMPSVIEALDRNNPDGIDYSWEDKGNNLRMDVYVSKKKDMTYVQLFEYIPYSYQPCSKIYEMKGSSAMNHASGRFNR
ncbi:MAG: hypothetical protein ACI3ZL_02665 [Candidatus Cryptobacteroides sp.]